MIKVLNKLGVIALLSLSLSCSDEIDFDNLDINGVVFEQGIDINNPETLYQIGDTIWITSELPSDPTDLISGNKVSINNPTVVISNTINLLKSETDSIDFLDVNFDLVVEDGTIELINVIDAEKVTFSFDVKYGLPLNTQRFKAGVVINFPGIFAIEATGKVFYGENRAFDDFSDDTEQADIYYYYNVDDVNYSIFTGMPDNYINYYGSYYSYSKVQAREFYFIEVTAQ